MKLPQRLKNPFVAAAATLGAAGLTGAASFVAWDHLSQPQIVTAATPVVFTDNQQAETPPAYLIAHVEHFSQGYNTQSVQSQGKYYNRHAEAAGQILTDSFTGEASSRSAQVGYVNRRYCNMDQMRHLYTHLRVVSISSFGRCDNDGSMSEMINFWQNESPTITFHAAGNEGRNRITAFESLPTSTPDYMDTRIVVGAGNPDGLPSYSSVNADVVATNPFMQGFAYPYYPTPEEARNAISHYDLQDFDESLVSPAAGTLADSLTGTSFAAPHAAGQFADMILEMEGRNLSSYTTWAAILSSCYAVSLVEGDEQAVKNARGIRYEPRRFGFGRIDENLARHILSQDYGTTQDIQMHEVQNGRISGSTAEFDMSQHIISGTTVGEIVVRTPENLDYFLMRGVEITSPSGTTYRRALHSSGQTSPDGAIRLFFRTTGFLGEDSAGTWKISLNHGRIQTAEFAVMGSNPGGMTDKMLDYVAAWREAHAGPTRNEEIRARSTPWSNIIYETYSPGSLIPNVTP